jgi:hypothetical protein
VPRRPIGAHDIDASEPPNFGEVGGVKVGATRRQEARSVARHAASPVDDRAENIESQHLGQRRPQLPRLITRAPSVIRSRITIGTPEVADHIGWVRSTPDHERLGEILQ